MAKPKKKNDVNRLKKKIKKGLTKHAALNEAAGAGVTPAPNRRGGKSGY